MKTHYDVLGVAPDADPETVKAAYRKAVKAIHPDLHAIESAEPLSKQINAAYAVLKDAERRLQYNEQLRNRRGRLRLLVIVGLVSAGLGSGITLFLLDFLLKPEIGAALPPIASALTEKRASAPETVPDTAEVAALPQRADTVEAALPPQDEVDAPSALGAAPLPAPAATEPPPQDQTASLPQPAPAAAVQETAWLAIEKSGSAEEVWAFMQAHGGTPEAVLAARRLRQLIDATGDIAGLERLAAMSTGDVAEQVRARLGELTATAALPEPSSKASPAETGPALASADDTHPLEPEPAAVAQEQGGAKLAAPDSGSAPRDTLSVISSGEEVLATPIPPIAPGNAGQYVDRATAWLDRGDLDGALADYDAAILLDDANIAAFHGRGLLRWRRGEVEPALADFDRAIRLSFSDPKIYLDRGKIWYERGRYDRAIADFNQAIKLAPSLASAYSYRGTALRRKRDFKSAIADFDEAIRLNPAIEDAYQNRDLARIEKDDPAEASSGVNR